MTLVSQIITDAYRQGDLIPLGLVPSAEQQTEALRYLNRLLQSSFGHEIGEPLEAFPVGNKNYERPSGYPGYSEVPDNDWFLPKNQRAVLNLNEAVSIFLTPAPDDGSRFAITDAANNLDTNPLTIVGNGRMFEGQGSVTISTPGFSGEWFYRADLGNWLKVSPILTTDEFPVPSEFDEYYITMLAMRLNPAYSITLDPQSMEVLRRAKAQLQARYKQVIPVSSELGLIRNSKMVADRNGWGCEYRTYNPNALFTKGWPW